MMRRRSRQASEITKTISNKRNKVIITEQFSNTTSELYDSLIKASKVDFSNKYMIVVPTSIYETKDNTNLSIESEASNQNNCLFGCYSNKIAYLWFICSRLFKIKNRTEQIISNYWNDNK